MRLLTLENVDMLSFHGVTTTSSLRGRGMSTSLLYHSFGISGYRYVSQKHVASMTIFRIEQPRERLRCSHCGSQEDLWLQGGVERSFRTVPIGKRPIFIDFKVPRVWCGPCGKSRQVKIASS